MQLHLETNELNLLANLLMERSSAAPPGQESYDDLLEMVLARDLRFDVDELEQMADLLAAEKRRLRELTAIEEDAAARIRLRDKLALVDRVQEKVDEVCVMI